MRLLHLCMVLILAAAPAAAETLDELTRVTELIEDGRHGLARAYLDPLVIDPTITGAQRSRAYYYRGFSFFAQALWVSAAQDYARALEFDTGNASAQSALAHLFAEGLGVDKDMAEAFRLSIMAARGGHAPSKFFVGHALLTGLGVEADVDKARYWLQEASDAGQLPALLQLARSYRAPYAAEPDLEEARRLYELAASRGATEAFSALGFMALAGELGETGEIDEQRAAELFERAADGDSAVGQAALAHLYASARGVPRDYAKARTLYERASRQDYAPGFTALGHLYEQGLGVSSDPTQARRYYRRGAELGDAAAQLRLAELAMQRGSRDGAREAIAWYQAAAEQGNTIAQNGLAWLLATTRFDELRNSHAALEAAQLAVDGARSASTLDTLAAAYAEAGRFDQALVVQREALAAVAVHEAHLAPELEARLDAYEHETAWRE